MRWRNPWGTTAAWVLAALAAWRVACVRSGPDIDTDAYAHHMIARAILADPSDLGVHWVWLPLFHYLQVPLVALGGTLDDVRFLNVALSAALPAVLFFYVRRSTARQIRGPASIPPGATACLAAVFAAACPIAMQMGTTAQPEPLFALLMLGVAITFQDRRYAAAAAMLSAAVMLRYEAWASLAAIGAMLAIETTGALRRGATDRTSLARGWLVVACPAALILIWAVLRRPVDGRWFGFLGQTREFATGATREHTALDRGWIGLVRDFLDYPIIVPARVFGPVILLVPFGIAKTVREQGGRFVAVLSACLGFVSLTWILRSSLGLDRHFVVVVALYATFAAQGAAALADRTARLTQRLGMTRPFIFVGRAAGGVAAALALAGLATVLQLWMRFWQGSIERGWPERAAIGAYLRSLPGDATIFCDDATIEILSGLDRRRFDRHWVDDEHTWTLIADVAAARGVAYVATWNRKLHGHEGLGAVVFRAGQSEADPNSGVAAMRVPPDPPRAER